MAELTPLKGDLGEDLLEALNDSIRGGSAIRIDGHHGGEPILFVAAKGRQAVEALTEILARKAGGESP